MAFGALEAKLSTMMYEARMAYLREIEDLKGFTEERKYPSHQVLMETFAAYNSRILYAFEYWTKELRDPAEYDAAIEALSKAERDIKGADVQGKIATVKRLAADWGGRGSDSFHEYFLAKVRARA